MDDNLQRMIKTQGAGIVSMSCLATMWSNVFVEGDIDINKQPFPVHGRNRP